MTLYELGRWAALYEAIELIADKCEEKNILFDEDKSGITIKPPAIQKYVDARADYLIQKFEQLDEYEKKFCNVKILF